MDAGVGDAEDESVRDESEGRRDASTGAGEGACGTDDANGEVTVELEPEEEQQKG